jgi:hypothetical protein
MQPAPQVGLLDIGSNIPERLSLVNDLLNPLAALPDAMDASQRMFAPDATGMERVTAGGDMLSGMAGVLAPVAGAVRAGTSGARALMEGLLGGSPTTQAAGDVARNFAADEYGGVSLPFGANDPATARAQGILDMLRAGRGADVTDEMLDMGDPVLNARMNEYLFANYDLPMDEASRMARAGEMGFGPALHGTGADIATVDPKFFGSGPDLLGSGFYTTTNPNRAERYVPRKQTSSTQVSEDYAKGGNILPLMVRERAPFLLEDRQGDTATRMAEFFGEDPFFSVSSTSSGVNYIDSADGRRVMLDPFQQKHYALQNIRKEFGPQEVKNVLTDLGYSGVSGPEGLGNRVRVSYDPSDIRSRFARFDPRLAHLRNLSAGIIPIGLLSMPQNEEQY